MRLLILFFTIVKFVDCAAQEPVVHDPVMIKQDDTYFLFATGNGVSVFSSKDMKTWKKQKSVFDFGPEWAMKAVEGFKGHIWAPDINYINGKYYLYYSVSAFGKNTSCIGVATNTTLDPTDKNYKWVDHGKVIQSVLGRDLWNAIDPNVVIDEHGQPWMAFGSFWSGIKIVKLDTSLFAPAQPEQWYSVSKRARDFKTRDDDSGSSAVEAPFIFKRGEYYYLFVSFDACCRGVNSTYRIAVGRSKVISGPYYDKENVSMNEGGGSIVLAGNDRWAAVGHNSVYTFDDIDYLVCHAYDRIDSGKPKLLVRKISWQDQWPVIND
jgi:arabinan endo-1,5-alpha-L-arabinosidase